jgi:hypothetical protein
MSRKITQEQINVRIDTSLAEVLEAAAFVERATVAELARGAIEGLARRYRAEPAIQDALRARDIKAGEDLGNAEELTGNG